MGETQPKFTKSFDSGARVREASVASHAKPSIMPRCPPCLSQTTVHVHKCKACSYRIAQYYQEIHGVHREATANRASVDTLLLLGAAVL